MSREDDWAISLFQEQCADLRNRTQPEFLLASAAIAGFGAVIWGVASISGDSIAPIVAGGWIWATYVGVERKIVHDGHHYDRIKAERARLLKKIGSSDWKVGELIPAVFLKDATEQQMVGGEEPGRKVTIKAIRWSAIAAGAFCVLKASFIWKAACIMAPLISSP
jgi:hypothetical protein